MAENTEQTPAQSATEGTSAPDKATSNTTQPEQRPPSTTPAAPDAAPSSAPTPAANGDDEIRDPAAYAKAQEAKYQRLLDKKAEELEATKSQLSKLETRLKTMEESQQAQFQTELDELKANLEKEKSEAETARMDALRVKVAVASGLPLTFADRLKGATEDELKADADKLLEAIPKQAQQPTPNSPLGNRAGSQNPNTGKQWREHGTSGFGQPEDVHITGG